MKKLSKVVISNTNLVGKQVGSGLKGIAKLLKDFENFLDRGNVIELAVAVVMGNAFTLLVESLVGDILGPIIGLATGTQLSEQFLYLRIPAICNESDPKYDEPECNKKLHINEESEGVKWNWGNFLQNCINFLLVSVCVFFIVKLYAGYFCRDVVPPPMVECEYCKTDIPDEAVRCPNCTSFLKSSSQQQEDGAVASAQEQKGGTLVQSDKASVYFDTNDTIQAVR